jgi:hypothetical protein
MTPFASLFLSPWAWPAAALSVWGLALVIHGVSIKAGRTRARREPSWDTIAFGAAVSAFMWALALRNLGVFGG